MGITNRAVLLRLIMTRDASVKMGNSSAQMTIASIVLYSQNVLPFVETNV